MSSDVTILPDYVKLLRCRIHGISNPWWRFSMWMKYKLIGFAGWSVLQKCMIFQKVVGIYRSLAIFSWTSNGFHIYIYIIIRKLFNGRPPPSPFYYFLVVDFHQYALQIWNVSCLWIHKIYQNIPQTTAQYHWRGLINQAYWHLGPLLPTWFNFNPGMDK